MKRTVSAFLTILLLFTLLLVGLSFRIPSVKANGTIYIRSDGTVEPSTANITTADNVTYLFTGDNYDPIVIERDSIIVDGAGYNLQGNVSAIGIDLMGRSNVTIKNVAIRTFEYGVSLYSSSNNSIVGNNIANNENGVFLDSSSISNALVGNNITSNNFDGIHLYDSYNNSIVENNVTGNYYGLYIESSSNNSIAGNSITDNDYYGIAFSVSSSNTLRNNTMADNPYNFGVLGNNLLDFVHDIDISNSVNGKPVCYWVNERDMTVPLDTGYVALINCTNIVVQNLNLTNNGGGVSLVSTTNSTITKNNITDNENGVLFGSSFSNTIVGNYLAENWYYGILLSMSSSNSIVGNNITNNDDGIGLYSSSDNNIGGNSITNSWVGIHLYSSFSNSLSENNITDNDDGIYFSASFDNLIYRNRFENNTLQAYNDTPNYSNFLDDGSVSGGNFWSDYNGTDLYSGTYQNETGSDGIGDTSYVIDANNEDRYPVIPEFPSLLGLSIFMAATMLIIVIYRRRVAVK